MADVEGEQRYSRVSSDGAVAAIGALTGVVLLALDVSPTGDRVGDIIVLLIGCTAAVWGAATAPWWAIAAVAGLATVVSDGWAPLVLGVLTFCAAVGFGARDEERTWIWALIVGSVVVVLATARDLGAWGVSSLVAIVAVVVLAALGLARRPEQRRLVAIAGGVVAALAVLSIAGLAVAANGARTDLSQGNRAARRGLRELQSGDFDQAQTSFAEATKRFGQAAESLDSPLAIPASVVPIASQHLTASQEVSAAAEDATRAVEEQLEVIDLEALRIVDGQIDIEAVEGLNEPMRELQVALDELAADVDDADSGWLIEPFSQRLDDLAAEIDEQRDRGENALAALAVAPEMLGADGERVYFVMFTTPVEARGQGGFMGNWAEITADNGRLTMAAFGNEDALNNGGARPRVLENAPLSWIARYGQFGFTSGEGGTVEEDAWKNITMSPDFPATAEVVAELYPKSGGREIDGVISLDVYALEALIDLVGPIEVEGAGRPLNGNNAANYLLLGQYRQFEGDNSSDGARGDMLEAVTRETVDRTLHTSPPDPIDLGGAMAPLVDERRVFSWSADEEEQAVMSAVGLDGTLRRDDSDMVAVTLNNAAGSKVDMFLDQSIEVVDGENGPEIHVELTNNAPSEGFPPYVIGNLVGLPDGYSRLWVTGYSSAPIVSMTNNGEPLETESSVEARLETLSGMIDLAPGESTEVVFQLDGDDLRAEDFEIVPQPLVRQSFTVDE